MTQTQWNGKRVDVVVTGDVTSNSFPVSFWDELSVTWVADVNQVPDNS